MIGAVDITAAFFAIGVVAFVVGALLNLKLWLLGSESISSIIT
ncbi:MAG: hypothetical protein QXR91_03735 [Nitrososphaerales archaeon]